MTVTYVTRDLLNITVAMCFRESLTITEWFAKVGNYIYMIMWSMFSVNKTQKYSFQINIFRGLYVHMVTRLVVFGHMVRINLKRIVIINYMPVERWRN